MTADGEWTVYYEVADESGGEGVSRSDLGELSRVIESLGGQAVVGRFPSVGRFPNTRRYSVQFAVPANNSSQAIDAGKALFEEAIASSGLPRWPVVRFKARRTGPRLGPQ